METKYKHYYLPKKKLPKIQQKFFQTHAEWVFELVTIITT